MSAEHRTLLDIARAAAHEAGEAILEIYRQDFAVWRKADDSPVTRADERAEAIIEQRLAATVPDIPVIAEEGCAAHGLPSAAPPRFWLVDPLDGTKEFIRRNGEFTVNIALVEGDRAVLGVVHVPSQGVTYAAAGSATRQRGTAADHGAAGSSARRDRRAQSFAWRRATACRIHRHAARRRASVLRQRAQILLTCRGGGRPLPTLRANGGMGYRRGPSDIGSGGWRGDDARRRAAALWQARLLQPRLHRARTGPAGPGRGLDARSRRGTPR